jgi:hypothetical protein
VNHEIAFSGDGATAGLVVAALFRLSTAVGRSDPIHLFHIQRLRLDDTGSVGVFVKEPMEICFENTLSLSENADLF